MVTRAGHFGIDAFSSGVTSPTATERGKSAGGCQIPCHAASLRPSQRIVQLGISPILRMLREVQMMTEYYSVGRW